MAIITTGAHPKALWPGVEAWFGLKYDEHPKEYSALFDVKSSGKRYEEIVESTGFGLAPQKTEGNSTVYEGANQGPISRFAHVAYSLGYVVTREELADNLYSEVSQSRAGALAFSMAQTKENVAANVYNRAGNTSYLGGDGLELLSTAHVDMIGGTYSNELNPAAAFSEAALEDLTIQIMQATNNKGLAISLRPTALIGPVNLVYEFERVLKSTLRPDTANNDVNALRSMGAVPTATVNHYLSDTNNWFVRTNAPEGMIMFEREGMEFTQDNDFDTDNAKAKAYMRFSVGWADPRALYGSVPA